MQEPPAPKGHVITFYSYKGGTGRSMALANVAWLLAMKGERVLVVDWDLEAPGIHRYFHPLLDDKELLQTEGLLDFVEKLSTRAAMSSSPLPEADVDVIEYVKMLKWPATFPLSWESFGARAGIDLLVAGRQGPLYGKRLNAFSFVDFYEKLGGRRLLSIAREQMRSVYDYVLIDSRTGVSDTSGICTVEMPETLVVCFTLNDQSIIGASGVAHNVLKQREAYVASTSAPESKFRIFPVPTRVEMGGEQGKLRISLSLARKKFAPFIADHIPRDAWSTYWGGVQMVYFPSYAFEEIPAVFGDPPHQQFSLLSPVRQIARAITGDLSLDLAPLAEDEEESERLRNEIFGWYVRKAESGALDLLELAQATYDQSTPADQQLIRRVMLRLVQYGAGSTSAPVTVEIEDLGRMLEPMARRLADSGILQISGTNVFIADRKIYERWDRLNHWLVEDEAFLAWRQSVSVSARLWRLRGKDASGLLPGKFLQEALEWLAKRPDDLTEAEREFIEESQRKKRSDTFQFAFQMPGTSFRVQVPGWYLIVLLLVGVVLANISRIEEATKRFLAPASEYWNVSNSGTSKNLQSIFGTSDGKRLWTVGDEGTILESSDGEHWIARNSGTTDMLLSVFGTSDGKRLWAVGNHGTILESSDGAHWIARQSGTSYRLCSILGTSDGSRLWTVGDEGTILESSDGEHWTARTSGTLSRLLSIFGTSDGKRRWAVGTDGTILESSDGEYWIARNSGTSNSLLSIFGTSDGKRLWAVGSRGTMLESSDGEHWFARNSETSKNLWSIFGTSDGKRLWVVGDMGTILESNDGEHWIARKSGASSYLWSIFGTSDGKRLWTVGDAGTILESHGR